MKKRTIAVLMFTFLLLIVVSGVYAASIPSRLISLYAAHTENLFSLGLGSKVVGVSTSVAFPPEAYKKPVFSYRGDPEKIIAQEPDLVLIRPFIERRHPAFVKKLKDAGISVVSLQPHTFKEMFNYWLELGKLTGSENAARNMINKFSIELKRIKSIVKKIPLSRRKKVFFETIHRGPKTAAPESIAMSAIELAGGINVAKDAKAARVGSNIADYSKERLLSHADEIDIYIAQKGRMNRVSEHKIYTESGYKAIKAIRNKQVYIIDEKIVSRPTMRLIYGIYELGRIMYPAYFNDVSMFDNDKPLNRIEFAQLLIRLLNVRYKTAPYKRYLRREYVMVPGGKHFYGDFKDIDYQKWEHIYAETAAFYSLLPVFSGSYFYPLRTVSRKDLAYAIFMFFDVEQKGEMAIKDVSKDNAYYNHIEAVVSNGIMKLYNGYFYPNRRVSGRDVIRVVKPLLEER